MNATEAVEAMRKGMKVTFAKTDTGIYYQMAHQEKILMLNTNGCENKITAYVDKVMTEQEFLRDCGFLGEHMRFKNYE